MELSIPDGTKADRNSLDYTLKYPVCSKVRDANYIQDMTIEIPEGIDKVTINGKVIWEKSDGYSEDVPEYVDEINQAEWISDDPKYAEASWSIMKNETVQIDYGDGTSKLWSLDGKEIK